MIPPKRIEAVISEFIRTKTEITDYVDPINIENQSSIDFDNTKKRILIESAPLDNIDYLDDSFIRPFKSLVRIALIYPLSTTTEQKDLLASFFNIIDNGKFSLLVGKKTYNSNSIIVSITIEKITQTQTIYSYTDHNIGVSNDVFEYEVEWL